MTGCAFVLAGGPGTRLWPLSRAASPKFLHDFLGVGRSLLQSNFDRLSTMYDLADIYVVTSAAPSAAVREQLPEVLAENFVVEPEPRESLAATALGAAIVSQRRGDSELVGFFPSDHAIGDVASYSLAVREAQETAAKGYLTTLGIKPTEPSTAYGYIELGNPLGPPGGAGGSRKVRRFVEKPQLGVAQEMLASKEFLWNSGVYVCRAGDLLREVGSFDTPMAERLRAVGAAWDSSARQAALDTHWSQLPKISIDRGVSEPLAAAGGVAVTPGTFDWDDLGDWAALHRVLQRGLPGVTVGGAHPRVVHLDSNGLVFAQSDRLVALLGVQDIAVVETEDALLITTLENAQDVGKLVARLRLTEHADTT